MIHRYFRGNFLTLLDDLNISVTGSIKFYLTPTATANLNYFRLFKEKYNCLRNILLKLGLKQSISSVQSMDSQFVLVLEHVLLQIPSSRSAVTDVAGGGRKEKHLVCTLLCK